MLCCIDVVNFVFNCVQKCCFKCNVDFSLVECIFGYNVEWYVLYECYLCKCYVGGGMDEVEVSDFCCFFIVLWSFMLFLEFCEGVCLFGVFVIDVCFIGVLVVYIFFDLDEVVCSFGIWVILQQVELVCCCGILWVYLGFWIEGYLKMDYKCCFQLLQVCGLEGWQLM